MTLLLSSFVLIWRQWYLGFMNGYAVRSVSETNTGNEVRKTAPGPQLIAHDSFLDAGQLMFGPSSASCLAIEAVQKNEAKPSNKEQSIKKQNINYTVKQRNGIDKEIQLTKSYGVTACIRSTGFPR